VPWIPNSIPEDAYGYTGEAANDQEIVDKICNAYRNLRKGGKMVLLLPNEHLYGNIALNSLWNNVLSDNSIKEIIQLPPVMGGHLHKNCSIVIAEKGKKNDMVTFTDARFAFDKIEDKNFKGRLNLTTLRKMMQNGGIEEETGLK
jgi:type I restriction-modification system DNA methylase subunit